MFRQIVLPSEPKRILVPRFDALGDIVLLEGFLEALQRRFPQAELTLLTRRACADLSPLFPSELHWLSTETDPQRVPPDFAQGEALLADLGPGVWDLALITTYNRTWADDLVAAAMPGATRVALGSWIPMRSLQRKTFSDLGLTVESPYDYLIPAPEKSHEIQKYQIFAHALVGDSVLPEPRLILGEQQRLAAGKVLAGAGLQAREFCICFPAGVQQVSIKTWPPDRFAEIVAWLEHERGLSSLIAGHVSESARIEEVAKLAEAKGARPKKWLGRDGEIPVLAAVINAAKFYLGNDTGPMHIAAAVKTPTLSIFGGGTWPRFIPRGEQSVAIAGEMPCFGCGWDCIFDVAPCMSLVSTEEVKRALDLFYRAGGLGSVKEHVLPASTRLSEETKWYIQQALEKHARIETDRRDRVEANYSLERLIEKSESDRAARLLEIERIGKQLAESESDRAARLLEIERIGKQLAESESDRAARLLEIGRIGKQLAESEADRAARLVVMERLEKQLARSEAAHQARVLELETVRNHVLVRLLIRLHLVRELKKAEPLQPRMDAD